MHTDTILSHLSHCSAEELIALIRRQNQRINSLIWNDDLSMLNNAGLHDAIDHLEPGIYIVVFADVNRLKRINTITGNHTITNRYLRDGLRVRRGEIAGQFLGDEFVFILDEGADAAGFCARISRQLAEQPLSQSERTALEMIDGPGARLSATFAYERSDTIWQAIDRLSADVLTQKAKRDAR